MVKIEKAQEKAQLRWGIELFLKFLIFTSKKKDGLPSSQLATLQSEIEELAKAASGEDAPEAISEQLNQYIGMVNAQIKQTADPKKYAPFPLFTFTTPGHERSAVLDQIDMIERTLTEAAEANIIDWEKESSYFQTILEIFSQAEGDKIRPQEAIAKLIKELEGINKEMPQEHQLPLPDLNAYQT